ETNTDAVEALLAADVLKKRADVLQYVDLLSQDNQLRNTIQKSVNLRRLSVLTEFKSRIDASTDSGVKVRQNRLATLWKLLKLDPQE
ncbi:MAG: hypothetical protein ABGZ17_11120, partial [Planctomycetaceae bacterium]